ncbi:MAG: hypothetical protein QXP70_01200, partial [Methanomassiliicoccales archaeon]
MNEVKVQSADETGEEGRRTIATMFVSEAACLLHAYRDDDGKVHLKPECPTKADEKQLAAILKKLYPEDSEVVVEKADIKLEGMKCEDDVCKVLGGFAKDA